MARVTSSVHAGPVALSATITPRVVSRVQLPADGEGVEVGAGVRVGVGVSVGVSVGVGLRVGVGAGETPPLVTMISLI